MRNYMKDYPRPQLLRNQWKTSMEDGILLLMKPETDWHLGGKTVLYHSTRFRFRLHMKRR